MRSSSFRNAVYVLQYTLLALAIYKVAEGIHERKVAIEVKGTDWAFVAAVFESEADEYLEWKFMQPLSPEELEMKMSVGMWVQSSISMALVIVSTFLSSAPLWKILDDSRTRSTDLRLNYEPEFRDIQDHDLHFAKLCHAHLGLDVPILNCPILGLSILDDCDIRDLFSTL